MDEARANIEPLRSPGGVSRQSIDHGEQDPAAGTVGPAPAASRMSASVAATTERRSIAIVIGGVTTRVSTTDERFLQLLDGRYAGFTGDADAADYELDVDLVPSGRTVFADVDVRVWREGE